MTDEIKHYGDAPIEFCGDQEGWIAVASLSDDSPLSPCHPRVVLLGVGLGPSGKQHDGNIAAMLTIEQAADLRERLTAAMGIDRPAPTPAVAPGLDLDAVERDVAHLNGPHSLFDERTLARILAICSAAPALIAEVRALRARLAEAKRLGLEFVALHREAGNCDGWGPFPEMRSKRMAAIAAALEAL